MKRLLLIVSACLITISAIGSNDTLTPPTRPKVGLVLAGGGARGASFIGVLKYLEELDIPIDYIIGTSMGSIIGGVYSMGYTPDEMADIITSIPWKNYIGNNIDRSLLSTELRDRHSTHLINVPFNVRGILRNGLIESFLSELPSAYVNNNDVDNLFNTLCQGYQDSISFDSLPIPFACIATDIVAGEEVVLRSGSLSKAIRASMAFPAIFSPIVIDGKLLYDGGMVNIFPSDVLRDMGADIIIGIEFTSERFFIGDKIPSVAKLLDYMYNFAIHVKREENKKLCDILIKPNTSEFGPLSFNPDAIDTLIVRGYKEAQKYHDALALIKQRVDSIAGQPVGKTLHAPKANSFYNTPVFVSSITIDGPTERQAKWLKRESKLHENTLVSSAEIDHAIKRYRGTGAFNAISYNLSLIDTAQMAYKLSFRMYPKSPDIFGFGAHYDTEEGAALLFSLGFNEKRLSGFKLNLTGNLSFNPKVRVIATYSLFPLANFNLAYQYRNDIMKLSVPDNGTLNIRLQKHEFKGYVSQYQILNLKAATGFSVISTAFTQVGLDNLSNDTTSLLLLSSPYFKSKNLFGPYFIIGYDNLDRNYFACRGISTTLGGHFYFDASDNSDTHKDISFSFQSYLTPWQNKLTIIPQFYGHYAFSDINNASLWTMIGGEVPGRYSERHLPFVGINHVAASANLTTILRCDLRYNFFKKNYLTAIYNHAFSANFPFESNWYTLDNQYYGIGLQYSYNSLAGPLSLTAHYSNYTKQVGFYLSLGYTF